MASRGPLFPWPRRPPPASTSQTHTSTVHTALATFRPSPLLLWRAMQTETLHHRRAWRASVLLVTVRFHRNRTVRAAAPPLALGSRICPRGLPHGDDTTPQLSLSDTSHGDLFDKHISECPAWPCGRHRTLRRGARSIVTSARACVCSWRRLVDRQARNCVRRQETRAATSGEERTRLRGVVASTLRVRRIRPVPLRALPRPLACALACAHSQPCGAMMMHLHSQ